MNPAPSNERGIALVAAVLVVLLSTLLVATYLTTTIGERAMSSNVQTAKVSLYAADAGVRTEQQQLANLAQSKIDSCVTTWNANGGVGQVISLPGNVFPNGTFSVTSTNPPFSATGSIAWSDTDITPNAQAYDYHFIIQSTGTVGAAGTRRVQAQGSLRLSASRGSFADYLIFLNRQTTAGGTPIWFTSSVTMDGRVHSNGQMNFAYKPTFQDAVTSSAANAQYYNGGGSTVVSSASNNGILDVPNFLNGFHLNQPNVPLPSNAYNQQEAAIGNGGVMTAPGNAAINSAIGAGSTGSTPANGIYVVNGGTTGVTGGIYVQGDLSQAKMWADTLTNRQWYQLTQGGTVRTILVDKTTNQTSVWNSGSTAGAANSIYTGTPNGMMYVNGGINDLRGPDRVSGQVLPAIAENTNLMITASSDIVIQRDVTLDNYSHNDNVLGIMSANGQVRVGSGAPNDMNVDAFIMAANSTNGQFAVDNYDSGSPRGTFHLRGGITESFYGPFFTFNTSGVLQSGFARDYHYDKRGLVPPFYPSTIRFNSNTPTARTLAWKEI